jgi:hypothetical protein
MAEWPKKIVWDLEPYFENPDGSRDQQNVEDGFPLVPADLARELYEVLNTICYYDMGAAERRREDAEQALDRYEREVGNA